MKITEREYDLIQTGLYLLESDCAGDELYYELADNLGGTPDSKEIRILMDELEERYEKENEI